MDNVAQWRSIVETSIQAVLVMYVLDRLRLIGDMAWVRTRRNDCGFMWTQSRLHLPRMYATWQSRTLLLLADIL